MTELDPALCARLVSDAKEDDRRMTPSPWICEADQLYHHSEEDGTILIASFQGDACVDDDAAIARTRNNLRDLAAQLEAALAEVKRLYTLSIEQGERAILAENEVNRLRAERRLSLERLSPTPRDPEEK